MIPSDRDYSMISFPKTNYRINEKPRFPLIECVDGDMGEGHVIYVALHDDFSAVHVSRGGNSKIVCSLPPVLDKGKGISDLPSKLNLYSDDQVLELAGILGVPEEEILEIRELAKKYEMDRATD